MSISVAEKVQQRTGLSSDQIHCLARTYDDVSQPIWIYDLACRCLYRNARATQADPASSRCNVFEIVDARGRTVAHLSTLAN